MITIKVKRIVAKNKIKSGSKLDKSYVNIEIPYPEVDEKDAGSLYIKEIINFIDNAKNLIPPSNWAEIKKQFEFTMDWLDTHPDDFNNYGWEANPVKDETWDNGSLNWKPWNPANSIDALSVIALSVKKVLESIAPEDSYYGEHPYDEGYGFWNEALLD